MSKVYPFSTATMPVWIKRLYTITRLDGTVVRFTDAAGDITMSSLIWLTYPGLKTGAVTHTSDASVPSGSIELPMLAAGTITPRDVLSRKFEAAEVLCELFDLRDPTVRGQYYNREIATVTLTNRNSVVFDIRGKQILGKKITVEHFGPMCATHFGSYRCKMPTVPEMGRGTILYPITRNQVWSVGQFGRTFVTGDGSLPAHFGNVYHEVTTAGTTHATVAPAYNGTVGGTTTDGTVVFTTRNAWARHFEIASIGADGYTFTATALPDPRAADDWFNQGQFLIRSGYLSGTVKPMQFKIGRWTNATLTVKTYKECTHLLAVGDKGEMWVGCARTLEACAGFDNILNNRATTPYYKGDVAALAPAV